MNADQSATNFFIKINIPHTTSLLLLINVLENSFQFDHFLDAADHWPRRRWEPIVNTPYCNRENDRIIREVGLKNKVAWVRAGSHGHGLVVDLGLSKLQFYKVN
jgi:hypothetical protein